MGTERKLTERSRYTADYDTESTAGPAAQQIGPCLLAPQQIPVGGPYYTTVVDVRNYEKALFCILGGAAIGNTAGLWVEVLQCTAPNVLDPDGEGIGVGAKSLAGLSGVKKIQDDATIASGYYGSYSGYYYYNMNRKWLIEVDVEEMDVDAGFRYLQVRYEVRTNAWMLAMEVERSLASWEPCPQTNVDEVVA